MKAKIIAAACLTIAGLAITAWWQAGSLLELLNRGIEQLLGRASGPLHFRLVIQPMVAASLAIRVGLKEARKGESAFLWTLITHPDERRQLLRSAWKDIGKIFIVALVLDTIYQIIVLREPYHLVQTLIVAVVLAVVPYVLIRGPVTRLARSYYQRRADSTNGSASDLRKKKVMP